MYSYGPPYIAGQKRDDQFEHTFSSYVRIRDVALKTCQRRWTIGRSGQRGSGISVQAARHDDEDNEDIEVKSHSRMFASKTVSFFGGWGLFLFIYLFVCFFYLYFPPLTLLRVFHPSVSRWFLTGVWALANLF